MINLTSTLLISSLLILSTAIDILTPDRPLFDDETLISADGSFALGFFTPGSKSKNRYVGIWYNKVSIQTVVWVANRNNPIANDASARLSITTNGTLIVTANNVTVVWESATTTTTTTADTVSNSIAQILDTGNFVVRDEGTKSMEAYAWQSFDYPTDTLLPGMKLGPNLKSGLNRNLTAWASLTDPSASPYTMSIVTRGVPQVFLWSGSVPKWRGGAWNGFRFTGVPEMETYSMFTFDFVQNPGEVYYQFHMKDPTIISRLIVNQTGSVQWSVWLNQSETWNLFWIAPNDDCDGVSPCGSFGVCNPNNSPKCDCLKGFVPRKLENWDLRDGSDGCVRKTQLDCRNGTDGFVTISDAKLPDTSSSSVDVSLSLGECRAKCLMNCSCTAYASANISGTGCLIWTTNLSDIRVWSSGGQDLYVRVADVHPMAAVDPGMEPLADNLSKRRRTTIAITVSLVIGPLLLSCIIYFVWRKRKTTREGKWNEDEDLELPLYDLDVIIAATDDFSTENKLGEGGFGPVYKGKLPEGQEIAVKRLSKTSKQGVDEFKNEVLLIAKLQHRNLVRLLGCCTRGEDRMLIYEYMPNKSLDAFLFDKAESITLGWRMRFHIITGIARGLLYLHQDSRFRIIHRDLKASNVLLDEEMNPKISDFGLARIFGAEEATARTRRVVGTYGYMSPEYAMDGIFSVKSDAFSFGVLVLEIVSGQRTKAVFYSEPDDNLLRKAWRLWSEGKGLELIDPAMGSDFSVDEVIRCIKVGLLCVQENPKARPKMSLVVHMLSNQEGASIFEPEQPGFAARSDLSFPSSSSTNQVLPSINDITFSLDVGR